MRRIACFWLVCATGHLAHARQDPVWTHDAAATIEWVEPIGGQAHVELLVCDERGRVELLDAGSGKRRWRRPAELEPGVVFAGSSADTMYLHGRHMLYALTTERDRGLRWKAELPSAGLRPTDGDPEFQIRTIAAKATTNGVLVVRSDGVIAGLSEMRGELLWHDNLGPIAAGTLDIAGSTAAVLWKSASETRVAFVDLDQTPPHISSFVLDVAPPIWRRLTGAGFVAVWPRYVRVVQSDGQRTRFELDADVRTQAAAIDVYESDDPLLLLSRSNSICAYALTDGVRRWPLPIDDSRSSAAPVVTLRVFGTHVLWYSRDTLRVVRAADGKALAEFSPTGEVLTATIDRATCWIVTSQNKTWKLHALSLKDGTVRSAGELVVSPGPRRFLWTPDRLVVIGLRRIDAYELP